MSEVIDFKSRKTINKSTKLDRNKEMAELSHRVFEACFNCPDNMPIEDIIRVLRHVTALARGYQASLGVK